MEFALISTLFFPMLFGMLDYGLWFADSLSARSAVRDGVRKAVVQSNVSTACDLSTFNYLEKLRCDVRANVGPMSGAAYVKVTTGADGWVKGKPLVICAMIKSDGVTGLAPLPGSGVISSRTEMSIEVDTVKPSGATGTGVQSSQDTLPSGFGKDWSWCV
ncbi:MAG TPA: TadE/TadG family type IV pilus assembly protein [Nocardioidaceae bacterium]|nr:TadE/TadG family type IV pilus assembly protein [Nocardioidaceae bacterium]